MLREMGGKPAQKHPEEIRLQLHQPVRCNPCADVVLQSECMGNKATGWGLLTYKTMKAGPGPTVSSQNHVFLFQDCYRFSKKSLLHELAAYMICAHTSYDVRSLSKQAHVQEKHGSRCPCN